LRHITAETVFRGTPRNTVSVTLFGELKTQAQIKDRLKRIAAELTVPFQSSSIKSTFAETHRRKKRKVSAATDKTAGNYR
jgi:hypothetical protein